LAGTRGSEWNRWEPHIHTPGTLHEDLYPKDDWHAFLNAVESASPTIHALGVTDYCVTRSYERVLLEKYTNGRLSACDLVFPNIELRLETATVKGNWINIHLLVSPEDPEHVTRLQRFLAELKFSGPGERYACTPDDLRRLGRSGDHAHLDDNAALARGAGQFKVSRDNLAEAFGTSDWAQRNVLIAVAANADGTSGVRGAADTILREQIEKLAHVMITGSPKQRDFWLGLGAASPDELWRRWNGPKPCIWGSDAHQLDRVGVPAEDRRCWIKGCVTFDALRQAVIDPERAYVGPEAPGRTAGSQIVDSVSVANAPWAVTPVIELNPGLVAVIGARGSGKTALADIVAAGCHAYEVSGRPSFLLRAAEHLAGTTATVAWRTGPPTSCALDSPSSAAADSYPRARYLSQQFVEELCSIEGMPQLVREIERVVFDAHAVLDRDGTTDFDELLELKVRHHRESRRQEEFALANLSDQIGVELDKARQTASLQAQVSEKAKLIERYEADRKALMPKTPSQAASRLLALREAADVVRGHIRAFSNRQATLTSLASEVKNHRQNDAPANLRALQVRHQRAGLSDEQWARFLLDYAGDVEAAVAGKSTETTTNIAAWKGTTPTAPVDASGSFIAATADISRTPLAVLEAEIARLEPIVALDVDSAKRLSALTKRIGDETSTLNGLKERLEDFNGAKARANALVVEREQSYARLFDAIVAEEAVLANLYAPLAKRLGTSTGTLGKLSFTVRRVADVEAWASWGEANLFDLRTGPFKRAGTLASLATTTLAPAWTTGDSDAVSAAMTAFRTAHADALLDKGPYVRTDPANYRPWTRRFAKWLYSTDHISIEYGISYDGIDIRKLSPGTRGIVLILLYLALDDDDVRPLIIDQPEENLDPQSVNDELVPLFKAAKGRRQVIMVTHNANLVVNTDADQIIVAEVGALAAGALPPIRYTAGGLDEQAIRARVISILEGGERAFVDRARRMRIALKR
jgi:hypothetical protein